MMINKIEKFINNTTEDCALTLTAKHAQVNVIAQSMTAEQIDDEDILLHINVSTVEPLNAEPQSINHNMILTGHETQLVFADGTTKYIHICNSMITVADCTYFELAQLIEADAVMPCVDYEAYDTIDGQPYYMNSEYAEYINCALLDIVHRAL